MIATSKNAVLPDDISWAYDAIARVYDDDMAQSAPAGDVEYYVGECRRERGPVLELGAGTGRITLPLVAAGLAVTAVDRSGPMLRALEQKARAAFSSEELRRLRVLNQDMRELSVQGPFAVVLCPYSAFTYLLSDDDRKRMLDGVRRVLVATGRLLLDVFVPDPAIESLPDDHVFFDYRRPRADGTFLERSKTIMKDVEPSVNVLERRYRILAADGSEIEQFRTRTKVHYWYPDDLRRELERHGFAVDVIPDFGRGSGAPVKMAVFSCRPR